MARHKTAAAEDGNRASKRMRKWRLWGKALLVAVLVSRLVRVSRHRLSFALLVASPFSFLFYYIFFLLLCRRNDALRGALYRKSLPLFVFEINIQAGHLFRGNAFAAFVFGRRGGDVGLVVLDAATSLGGQQRRRSRTPLARSRRS